MLSWWFSFREIELLVVARQERLVSRRSYTPLDATGEFRSHQSLPTVVRGNVTTTVDLGDRKRNTEGELHYRGAV